MKKLIFTLLASALLAGSAAAQTLDRIRETGQMKLGYRVDAPPLSYKTDDGKPAGYSPLVCAGVAQALVNELKLENLDVEFVAVDVTTRFEKVAQGEIDLLCGAATITLGRRELVDFSTPTFVDGTSILMPANASGDFGDLAGKKVGVLRGTTTEMALANTLDQAELEVTVVRFVDHQSGILAMENAQIDAYFADQSILAGLWMSSPKMAAMKLGNDILTVEKQGLAMARGDSEFRLLVDRALSGMFARGEMQRILEKVVPGIQVGDAMRALYLLGPTVE